jgi:hypothetical protein
VLHSHVETLLNHTVLHVHVAAWANHSLGAASMVETSLALLFETFLARIEHNRVLQVLAARLVKRLGPVFKSPRILLVLTWSRNLKLKTLAVEYLVELESWRGGIEADFLSGRHFVVTCTSAFVPSTVVHASVAEAGNLVFNTHCFLVLIHHLLVVCLCHNLFPGVPGASKKADSRTFS